MKRFSPRHLRDIAVLCAGVALLVVAAVLISAPASSPRSPIALPNIFPNGYEGLSAATWLGTQQGYPSYSGYPMPLLCWARSMGLSRNIQGFPPCENYNLLGIFSAHPGGSTAGASSLLRRNATSVLGPNIPTSDGGVAGSYPTVGYGQPATLEWSCQDYQQVAYTRCGGFPGCPEWDQWTAYYTQDLSQGTQSSGFSTGGGLVGATTIYPTASAWYTLTCTPVPVYQYECTQYSQVWVNDNCDAYGCAGHWETQCTAYGNVYKGPTFTERSQSLLINVSAPPQPSLSLSANPGSVGYGGASTVSWSATGGLQYTACYLGGGRWGGGAAAGTSGSDNTGALYSNTAYSFSCYDTYYGWQYAYTTVYAGAAAACTFNGQNVAHGSSVTAYQASSVAYGQSCTAQSRTCNNGSLSGSYAYSSCTVGVPPNPSLSLSANPTSVGYGGASTVSWSATGGWQYTACLLSGGQWGSGVSVGASGSAGTGALYSNTAYGFQCYDTYYGWRSASPVTVYVGAAPAPTADIKANGSDGPITISYNSAATISWTSTDATSCSVAPPGWTGTQNGGISTGNLTTSQTYTLTCTGAGGSANNNVVVNVVPAITCLPTATDAFAACYHTNQTLTAPALTRTDAYPLNFNWGTGSPGAPIGVDNFSASWKGNFTFQAGDYTFTTTADDGVRVYVDGALIIDHWVDQGPTTYTANRSMTAGTHLVEMQFYENGGGATAVLSWAANDICTDISGSQTTTPPGCQNPSPSPGICIPSGYTWNGSSCVAIPPTISSFSANPARVKKGNTSTLFYTVQNPPVGGCSIAGTNGFSTTVTPVSGVQGSVATNAIQNRTDFTLTCGAVPAAQATVTIVPTFIEI